MIIFDSPQQYLSFIFDKSFTDFPIANDKKISHLKLAICHHVKFYQSMKKLLWWTTVDGLRLSAILLNFNIDVAKKSTSICKLSISLRTLGIAQIEFLKVCFWAYCHNASSFNNRTCSLTCFYTSAASERL